MVPLRLDFIEKRAVKDANIEIFIQIKGWSKNISLMFWTNMETRDET